MRETAYSIVLMWTRTGDYIGHGPKRNLTLEIYVDKTITESNNYYSKYNIIIIKLTFYS